MEYRPVVAVDSSSGNAPNLTIHTFVLNWAKRTPDAIAILAPGRLPLTYGLLNSHIENTVRIMNKMGIGRNDRVAVVLPDGSEMAVAFLSVASGATCAPINWRYQAEEFDFFLSDLKAKALVVQTGMDSPAIGVAERKGIDLIRLSPMSEAGAFTLDCEKNKFSTAPGFAQPSDVALVLHTSGTIARPKIVPLTHSNICISANNVRETLKLENSDCCLNIMPLFHIHGLIGAVLSSMSAGASIVCTRGFHAPRFFEWMKDFLPTWFTAVPTMLQAILACAGKEKKVIKHCRLRFIRSCSSALPPQVMADLEKTFNVPVIEAYGMTEASHQIASNPLPPRKRKAGSVGVASGPEIAVIDDKGNLLARGGLGEIVIRGANVTKGYENNPEANKKTFINGWFRTGDQGCFDEDNYLTITDRIKEIINRAGEKISPREIDEVLLSHPSISQAVTFAVLHPRFGEDIAAAVVLHDNATATEWDIQEFAASRLADFKIPRHIFIVDQIPKGSTGKIQRVGLAEKLGLTRSVVEEFNMKSEYKVPSTPMEERLARIWSKVLGINRVGVNDNFFQLGGDSIQARLIISCICEELQLEKIPVVIFLRAPTIEKMACILSQKGFSLSPASLTALQSTGSKPPFYCVHACDGEVLFLADLARRLGPDQPFYALRAQGPDGKTELFTRIEDMASHYLGEIQAFQPKGPYFLGGAGVGGIVALEMAQRLMSQGKNVAILVLMDTLLPRSFRLGEHSSGFLQYFTFFLHHMAFFVEKKELLKVAGTSVLARLREPLIKITHNVPGVPNYETWERNMEARARAKKAVNRYVPKTYPGRVILFVPEKREVSLFIPDDPVDRIDPWRRFVTGPFDAHVVAGEHLFIFKEPFVQVMAQKLKLYLDEASAENNK